MDDIEEIIQAFWQELLDKDDRNSPAEYPDMCLITHKELADMLRHVRGCQFPPI